MVAYLTVKQESLVGFDHLVKPAKPAKKKAEVRVGPKPFSPKSFGGAFYGNVVPMPRQADGSHYACPCGRVYLLASALGEHLLFDSEAPIGQGTLAKLSAPRARHHLSSKGCALHHRADLHRSRSLDKTAAL